MSYETLDLKSVYLACTVAFPLYKKYGIDYIKKSEYRFCVDMIEEHKDKTAEEAVAFFKAQLDRIN